ncbi:MAG: hypothetical protein Q8O67_08180 [Deltaproteobacteria bacterium]|nr:hypothetical protein [Deltaproteobacteria bacterium]
MPSRPAYVLLVVMIVAAAAASAAALLVVASGQGTISAISAEGGELARSTAEAGLEHTLSLLSRSASSDFDDELDPGLLADCTNMATSAAVPTCAKCGLPLFKKADGADAAIISYEGQSYRLVPFNGGAYMVRYEDDDDDHITDANGGSSYASFTNNNKGVGDKCVEGLTVTNKGQNPVRDRNRAIWVNVVGIYPGTDPLKAKHRSVLRKLHTSTPAKTVAGMEVLGSITVEGSASFFACSPIGAIEANGNFQDASSVTTGSNPRGGCACGDSRAANLGGFTHCNDDPLACSDYGVECAEGELSTPGPTPPALAALDSAGDPSTPEQTGTDFYFEWDRPCIFYLEKEARGVWFWDATKARGPALVAGGAPQSCSAFEGKELRWPGAPLLEKIGDTESDQDQWRGCWTPLMWNIPTASLLTTGADVLCQSGGTPGITCCGPEASAASGRCEWRPDNQERSFDILVNGLSATDRGLHNTASGAPGLAGLKTRFVKPAWGTACTLDYPPFPTDTQTTETLSCSKNKAALGAPMTAGDPDDADIFCDGTNAALKHVASKNMLWFAFDAAGASAAAKQRLAAPAGVYFFEESVSEGGSALDMKLPIMTTLPSGRLDYPEPLADNFPLITVATFGSFEVNGNFILGVGQATPNYPAMMMNGSVTMKGTSNYMIGGSMWSQNSVDWSGSGENVLYGELRTNNSLNLKGTGHLLWLYTNALQKPPPTSSGPPITYPVPQ